MLEHVPQWLSHALRSARAGHGKLLGVRVDRLKPLAGFELTSPAFAGGAVLPTRFTADGTGVSPPLLWTNAPAGTRAFALVVEDPDAPTPQPLVHAIVWGIGSDAMALAEGAIVADGAGDAVSGDTGRNSFLSEGWLPPDPPTGHGPHDYVFQLFALDDEIVLAATPGRGAVEEAIVRSAIGIAVLVGTYQRGDVTPAAIGTAVPA